MERTSIDDWIGEEDMDLEDGGQVPQSPVPQSPNPSDEYDPTTPRGSDSGDEMDTGMVGLLETCSGREDLKAGVVRAAGEILKMVRDLGGSVSKYKRERSSAMKGIVSEIYRSPRVTKMVKMKKPMPVPRGR